MGDRLSTVIRDLTPDTTYYFKVQARNSKGNGPMSPTVIFRTPMADGTGGGPIETPADYGQTRMLDPNKKDEVSQNRQNSVPPLVLWIVISVIGGVTVIAVMIATYIVCRKKSYGGANKRKGGYMPANKGVIKGGPKDIKPPDLWIHDMEMKNLDKNNPESTMTVTPIRRKSQDMKGDDGCSDMDKRRNSFMNGEHSYDSLDEERYRRPARGKPMIMIPVDQPPPPREPIATAIPNGHLVGPESTSTPIRPVYPRTQYPPLQSSYTASPPRVHAGDIGPPPGSDDQHMSTAERRRAKDKHRRHSATRTVKPQQQQQQQQPQQQQQSSPYKKPPPPTTTPTPSKARSPMPVVTPKAPDVTVKSGDKTDTELPKSYSAEELSAEMANLEGLMKDLNAITQQEFEC
jgi:neogenin